MGIKDWLKGERDSVDRMKYHYELGCEVLGVPHGGWWMSTLADRTARVEAGRREAARRAAEEDARNRQAQHVGVAATDAALGMAYRHAKQQRGRDVQFDSDGIKVLVKNGHSRKYNRYTTDIILIDPGRPGFHLHYVLDEHGNEIHSAWTKNHP